MRGIITEKLAAVAALYSEGFANMRLGRRLWLLIFIKLLVMFGVLKVFFFPDVLQSNFGNDAQRSAHVLEQLTQE